MRRMAYFTLFLLIFFYCPSPAFSAQGSQDLGSACSTCTEHLLVASYVNVRDFTSNLLLNNKGPDPLPISLAFFTLKGDPLPTLPITLPENSPKLINLNELVVKNGLPFQEGNLQIRYQYAGCLLVLSAGMIQRIPSRGIVFDELLARPSTFRSSQLEAVFPLSSYPKSIGLTLTNTSPLKVKASIRYDALAAQNFSTQTEWLKPHETKVFYVENLYAPRFQGKVGPAGGVSIQHDGKPGDVVARGFLANASSGYSASVDFADPAMAETSTLQGGGLHLGPMGLVSLEPSLVVRNVGDASSSVTVKVPYLYKDGSTGLASLPIFSLEPGEIRVIKEELIQTLSGLSLQSNSQSLGLEIDYSTKPGTVVAFSQSVSPDGEQVFQLPLVDPGTKGAAGDYPWFITDTSPPVVFLKNTTDKDQDYTVQIDFDGGEFVNGLKKIPAHQTAVIDIQELRDQELKDERGKTIPMTASSGKVSWSVVGPDAHSMIGRIEQTDLTAGISYSFACSNCCPNSYYDSFMNPNPILLLMGGTVLVVPSEQDRNCYGGLLIPYTVSPSYWISGNPNIVTVQSGTVSGISPGESTVTAQWVVNNWSPYKGYCVNHQVVINRGAPAKVRIPNSLQVKSTDVLPDGPGPPCGCPGSANYGIKLDIKYSVLDQFGVPLESDAMRPHETGTYITGGHYDNDIGPVPGFPTSSKMTAADGTFHDVPMGVCSSLPIYDNGSNVSIQYIDIILPNGNSYMVRQQQWKFTGETFGHGAVQNTILSPGSGSDVNKTR